MTDDEELFVALYAALRRFAAVVGQSDDDPDDLVQEALARRLSIGPLAELDDAGVYLRRAIANLAQNRRRSLRRRARALDRLRPRDETVVTYPSDLAELLRLTPRERGALYLHEVEGWPFTSVAEQLGCSEAAARTAASRARRRLAARLTEDAT